jgi:hypothetical protein
VSIRSKCVILSACSEVGVVRQDSIRSAVWLHFLCLQTFVFAVVHPSFFFLQDCREVFVISCCFCCSLRYVVLMSYTGRHFLCPDSMSLKHFCPNAEPEVSSAIRCMFLQWSLNFSYMAAARNCCNEFLAFSPSL